MMSVYIHHLPGRLRIRTGRVKSNPQAADLAKRQLSAMKGVLSAEANPVTGSVTLRYDPTALAQHELLDVLRHNGYIGDGIRLDAPPGPENVVNRHAEAIAEKLATLVVKKALERSVAAFIRVLT